ncbi:hypothetical protein ACFL43_03860 [Thermodesulfobacteriota bacterium]
MCVVEEISNSVDSWIAQEEMAVRPGLKTISRFDEVRGPMMFEDDNFTDEELELEQQAYREFVSWYLSLDYLPVLSLPENKSDKWFPPKELDEFGNDVSAFNTMDFKRMTGWKPKVEAWQLKQVMDRLFDLAQTHSCISQSEGRRNIEIRFKEIVDIEFVQKLQKTGEAKYLKRLHEAHKIWKETAFQI